MRFLKFGPAMILLIPLVTLLASSCTVKDRIIEDASGLKNKFSDASFDEQNKSDLNNKELTGMLLVLDPEKCPLVEGCGPQFSLLGRELSTQIVVDGDFPAKHNNLILSVVGDISVISSDLSKKSGYENINVEVDVKKYRLRSRIPYYPYLVDAASNYTQKNFGCTLLWDKSYRWNIESNVSQLIVRMTNSLSAAPQPWMEMVFDGNTGNFISASSQPENLNPCS